MFFWRPPPRTDPLRGPDTSAARRESVERAEGALLESAEGAPSNLKERRSLGTISRRLRLRTWHDQVLSILGSSQPLPSLKFMERPESPGFKFSLLLEEVEETVDERR